MEMGLGPSTPESAKRRDQWAIAGDDSGHDIGGGGGGGDTVVVLVVVVVAQVGR